MSQRLRQKVIAGEALTPAELEELEADAVREGTLTSLLAVAHALMNGDADRRALELLERLRRDRGDHPELQLALARAHLGLEQYDRAEAALKRALALRPGDPEALKSLAALLLRHGELERSRRLVADALLRDPFDGEARALKEELDAVDPATFEPPPASFTLSQFVHALLDALRRERLPHSRRGSDLLLRVNEGQRARLDLPGLHADAQRRGAPLAVAISELVRELRALQQSATQSPEAQLQSVLPVLRPPQFAEAAPDALHREGPAGLLVFYAFEDPQLVRYVPARGPLTLDSVDRKAFENLAARPAQPVPVSVDAQGNVRQDIPDPKLPLCAVAAGDGHDAARLLTSPQRALLARALGQGPWHVHLGRRELAVVGRGSAQLASLPVAADGIAGVFQLSADGVLSPA